MAKAIMIQGTASNVGKSLICAGLCRIFRQDGFRVAPFKSQNMALNSYITKDGLEIGRAQAAQAQAAGIAPTADMNPILLKPNSESGSQVIVNGEVIGDMEARQYFQHKAMLVPHILQAYQNLASQYDIIVIEGAGSPVELNLNQDDFVNMGMAKIAKAPVLLVGDIDKGGIFAQIYGTVALLSGDERELVKATIVNKFRGDITLFDDGRAMLAEITQKPVAGVVPFLEIDIDEEDSLSEKLNNRAAGNVDIAVIHLPKISNFTDFAPINARYVAKTQDLGKPDILIIPGTKNTLADLKWMQENGFFDAIKNLAADKVKIYGICGGYQILGETITDGKNTVNGLGLLPVTTQFMRQKRRTNTKGIILETREEVFGYEIHMGTTTLNQGAKPFILLENGEYDGCVCGNVYGTYLHGFFDGPLREDYRNQQYDRLANHVRQHLDMKLIYQILDKEL